MGISVGRLFRAADLVPSDALRWGLPPDRRLSEPGVYVVSVADDPDRDSGIPWPGCDMEAVAKWVSIRNGETTLDGKPADENNISDRLSEFWLETQPMVYIGMTEKQC